MCINKLAPLDGAFSPLPSINEKKLKQRLVVLPELVEPSSTRFGIKSVINVLSNMLCLRGGLSFLEIVFVGQREVLVCLEFVEMFFPLAAKLIGP